VTGDTMPEDVIAFWFEAGPKNWFKTSETFDETVRARFANTVDAAAAGKIDDWSGTARGALALVLLLDQFTRNLNRGKPETWANDAKALAIAEAAVARGFDTQLSQEQKRFFYMVYMHSEDRDVQTRSLDLCKNCDDEEHNKYARHHADIIARFGRFPHRNVILGRKSTEEELAYLSEGGFKG